MKTAWNAQWAGVTVKPQAAKQEGCDITEEATSGCYEPTAITLAEWERLDQSVTVIMGSKCDA